MDIRMLGPLEVLDSGLKLEFGGVTQRSLLAVLILHANEVVSVDRLIDELWGPLPAADRRTAGIAAEPRVAAPGRDGVNASANEARLLVMGLSGRFGWSLTASPA
jgi:hypothetical protein